MAKCYHAAPRPGVVMMKSRNTESFHIDSVLEDVDYTAVAEYDDDLEETAEPARKSSGAARAAVSRSVGKHKSRTTGNRTTGNKSAGKQLQVLEHMVPGRDLSAYITAVNGIAMLTAEEEQALARDYYYHENLDAARKLVMAHLR